MYPTIYGIHVVELSHFPLLLQPAEPSEKFLVSINRVLEHRKAKQRSTI